MESSVQNVPDIDPADREALERVVGRRLRDDQQIIEVVRPDVGPTPQQKPQQRGSEAEPQVPDWWKVYEALSDEEIDRLDEAVRRRADLTRVFEWPMPPSLLDTDILSEILKLRNASVFQTAVGLQRLSAFCGTIGNSGAATTGPVPVEP